MQADIHPAYQAVKVTCSCGHVFDTRSTMTEDMSIDICSKCHPFYTGQQKMVDTAGRIDRFRKKYGTKAKTEEETTDKK
jgi:large subunit ribosomal protein L31